LEGRLGALGAHGAAAQLRRAGEDGLRLALQRALQAARLALRVGHLALGKHHLRAHARALAAAALQQLAPAAHCRRLLEKALRHLRAAAAARQASSATCAVRRERGAAQTQAQCDAMRSNRCASVLCAGLHAPWWFRWTG
jgi:hypothetical protein